MGPSRNLLAFVSALALCLSSITLARGADSLAEFTVTFEWAATPTLTLSKGQGDTYQLSLEVDSVPSKRLPSLLADLDEHQAPKVAVVRMTPRDENAGNAHIAITFEPIQCGQVGATLKLLTDLLDLQEITMDAGVFEGKRGGKLLNLLRADESTARGSQALHEFVSAIAIALPDTKPHDSGWIVEMEGYHRYEAVK